MRGKFDLISFFLVIAIGSLSLLVTFAINRQLAVNQLVFWMAGLVIFFLAYNFDIQVIKKYSGPFFLLTLASLLVLFIAGEPIRGSVRWFDFGFIRVQPSEIAKVSSIFLLGSYFAKRLTPTIKTLATSIFLISLPAAMVFKQPDLGNALCFFAIWLGISFVSGIKARHLLMLILVVSLLIVLGYEFLNIYQKERLLNFLNPQKDPLGTGYNVIQSQIAVGSGQIIGRGLGRGSQSQLNFLPEAESDFMFASLTEQLGLLGASLLIGLYVILITRIMTFSRTTDHFSQLVITGICSYLIFQILVNIGMNIGILPVTGITLPLVSYGGSSLISTLFLLGIAFNIKKYGSY